MAKISRRTKAALSRAGLPAPQAPLSRKEFAALQAEWYAKLAADNFEDIEWIDHKTGKGHNSPFLRGSLQGGKVYHAGRDLYYRMATNYLYNAKSSSFRGYRKFIWNMHAHGATYQEIVDAANGKYKERSTINSVFYDIKHVAALCIEWNRTSPEGLMVKWEEDKVALENSALQEFIDLEYDWTLNKNFNQE